MQLTQARQQNIANPKLKAGIEKAAKDLKAAGGNALVVSGSNNPNVQILVNAINEAIGANGKTINWSVTNQTKQGVDSEFAALVADMEAGRVGAIVINDVNPAYNYFDSKRFADALKKVKVSVALSYKQDETAELCKFMAPVHHFLESWGDAEAVHWICKHDAAHYFSIIFYKTIPGITIEMGG